MLNPNHLYWNPTRRWIEHGAVKKVPEIVSRIDSAASGKILLIHGSRSFRASRHYRPFRESLLPWGVVEAEGVEKEPGISFLKNFIERYRGKQFLCVIGVGGGSVLDTAKTAALHLSQPDSVWRSFTCNPETFRDFPKEPLPLIVLPTTAGTGSEVTPYASFENDARRKITLEHPFLFPRFALIDPELAVTLPAPVTASAGFDALSQAVEAFWAVRHTAFSDTHALRAVSLILQSIEAAVRRPRDRQARFQMALAANEAGLAIAQTRTTAVHAVSYPLTTFFRVPHGHACALTLSSFIRFNGKVLPRGRARLLWQAMGCRTAGEAARKVEKLMDDTGLERRLGRLGLNQEGIETVVKNGFRPDRVKNNPRPLTPAGLRGLLKKIL